MTIHRKMIGISVLAVACFSLVSFLNVSAQETTINTQQTEQIRSSCTSLKNTLNQLHSSDALLRVNRGQTYESILTKLIDKFNSRLSNNNISNDGLKSATNEYSVALDTFRQDYKSYEEKMASALNIDCVKRPAAFYDAVALARSGRMVVHADVARLNLLIDTYQQSLDQFEKDYQAVVQGLNK